MTSSIRLKEMDSKSPDLPEVVAPSRVPRLRPSWEKESFNGKLKRLWILNVCGTDKADSRIEARKGEISSILRRLIAQCDRQQPRGCTNMVPDCLVGKVASR